VPMPLQRKGWRCHSCNAEWEGEENPPTEPA
jgi:hypothetical protein